MGSSILNLSTRAMLANTSLLQTVSHNISNANTEGYSRQSVELATEGGQFSGAGFFGRGVRVQDVTRSSDQFLTREANVNLAVYSADQTRLDKLKQLEKIFSTGESGIGYAASQLMNSFVDVANQPQDLSARQVVLARAQDLASRVQSAGTQLVQMQSGILADLKTTVAQINDLAKQVADVNQKIAIAQGAGHPPNDLLDTRDQLVKELNTKVQVSTVMANDGTMSVFMGGGQRLVLGNIAERLDVKVDDFDATYGRVVVKTPSGDITLDDATFTGGSIKGLLNAQDIDIPQAQNQLGQIAAAISWQLNTQQSLGISLGKNAGAGPDLFKIEGPQVLPSRYNTSSLSSPPVSLEVIDGRFLQANDYLLEADSSNPGGYLISNLSDSPPTPVPINDGDEFDGLKLHINGASSVGDRFLLRPVGAAAVSMTRALDDPAGIAAASPIAASLSLTPNSTLSVKSLDVLSPKTNNYDQEVQISFATAIHPISGETYMSYTLTNATTGDVISDAWNGRTKIQYNGWQLELNGIPKDGDLITIRENTNYTSSNNSNALTMLGFRDDDIVGRKRVLDTNPSNLSGYIETPGASLTTAYSQLIGNVGVMVQSATTSADISGKLSNDSETLLKNKTGVNLDEEAAKMIQYQQNYQAAAKVLQVAQSVFNTLMGIING